jgi:hypothetical protein
VTEELLVAEETRLDPAERSDHLFATLCALTEILDRIGARYWLAGGSLLGGVREKDLIKHDTDWDIDCLSDDQDRILAARDQFEAAGLFLTFPYLKRAISVTSNVRTPQDSRLIKVRDAAGRALGDIYLFTLFADGMIRRFDLDNFVYYNPKMSLPMWFYEEASEIRIRDRVFRGPRFPEAVLAKIYGPLWKVPLTRHNTPKGYNFAGAILDADVENLISFAYERGWNSDYSDRPAWPQPVHFVNSKAARGWIKRHEHLELISPAPGVFPREMRLPAEPSLAALHRYRLLVKRLKAETVEAQAAEAKTRSAAAKLKKEIERTKREVRFLRLICPYWPFADWLSRRLARQVKQ